ncbi:Predicted secreted hydrolase [Reichenbachiella agariperforans]|uniref:Predicted secreted hydrolase n=1 Tax=Reichenbachiella agariperforans TaxID=156994 RepID=A0A1M6KQG8_REIAG|nr:lipocalin-like domain-containing protein [Reichenbachiella agariperforans]SHJ61134.1 Predicted secreted hydrolase [Reichenbachiella agariperforans]
MKTKQKIQVPAIQLPKDQYAHVEASTEWWWHIGTLQDKFGKRKFGFEVNATRMETYGLIQISVADINAKKHYECYEFNASCPTDWAESDLSKPWSVNLAIDEATISMNAPQNDPTNMNVRATFQTKDGTACTIDIQVNQVGPPLLVWGTGIKEVYKNEKLPPLKKNNYYYSLTNLVASGTIIIGDEIVEVEGTTWMDHEYGAFPASTKWILQDVQLENGIQLSNYALVEGPLIAGQAIDSHATVLLEDGTSVYVPTKVTPLHSKSLDGFDYFMEFSLAIENKEFDIHTTLNIVTLMDDQVFTNALSAPIYEGVASCSGTYNGTAVQGAAWIEQNIKKNVNSKSLGVANPDLSSYTGYYILEGAEEGAFLTIDTNQTAGLSGDETGVTISYSMDGEKSVTDDFGPTYSFEFSTLTFPNGDTLKFDRGFDNGVLTSVSGKLAGTNVIGSNAFNPVSLQNFAGDYYLSGGPNDGDLVLSVNSLGEVFYAFSSGKLSKVQKYTYNPAMYVLQFKSPEGTGYILMLGTGGALGLACSIIEDGQATYAFSCTPSV